MKYKKINSEYNMDRKYKIGLTIGKFAPFHKGHQFLIETALSRVDKLIVMIYDCPEITNIPLSVRAGWIKKLYHGVVIIEAYGSPKKIGKDEEAIKAQTDYILGKVSGYKITHFFSSEWYGKYVSKVLGAENVLVDADRKKFPISGSLSRSDIEKYKDMINQDVYRDLMAYK